MYFLLILMVIFTPSAYAANPFNLGQVDYFNSASLKDGFKQKEKKSIDWREPILGTNGVVSYYIPPAPVLALLSNPNDETAKAYVEWQNAKMAKIQMAQEAVGRVLEKEK
jgi:hypothetical protein